MMTFALLDHEQCWITTTSSSGRSNARKGIAPSLFVLQTRNCATLSTHRIPELNNIWDIRPPSSKKMWKGAMNYPLRSSVAYQPVRVVNCDEQIPKKKSCTEESVKARYRTFCLPDLHLSGRATRTQPTTMRFHWWRSGGCLKSGSSDGPSDQPTTKR